MSRLSIRPPTRVLATMRRQGVHVARSVDREGPATGILFLEDVIEELVGRVDDATSAGGLVAVPPTGGRR